MMMVDTELRPSAIEGLGVFILRPVAKGELVWRFDSRVDSVYSEEEVVSLPKRAGEYLRRYSTWHEGARLWVLCGDNGRYFNHSDTPNTISDGIAFGTDVAAHDLAAGTELTSDYAAICDHSRRNGVLFNELMASPHRRIPAVSTDVNPA